MILLGQSGILEFLKKVLAISDWAKSQPFYWNPDRDRLERKNKEKQRYYRIQLAISTIYVALAAIQVFRVFKGSTLVVITHSIMFLSSFLCCLSCNLVNYKELTNVVELFNSLVEFERRFTQPDLSIKRFPSDARKKSPIDLLLRLFICAMTSTGIVLPIVYHLDILRNPCYPLYVGYWLSNQCDEKELGIYIKPTWSVEEIGTKVGISLVSYFVWSFLLTSALFQTSLECIVQGHCLRNYIAVYGQKLMSSQISLNAITTSKLYTYYRQLQLLCIQYRVIYSRFMIGSIMPCFMSMSIMCLYNTIKTISGQNTNSSLGYNLLYAWAGSICMMNTVYMFGILADVHNVSQKVLRQVRGKVEFRKDKWFRKWLKSCPTLKIFISGSNYLEKRTPLNLTDFVIQQTVSLLLLKN